MIDARIPLGVTEGLDPNGFTNALAAGMKMREVQNASARLDRKDELATAQANALSKFGRTDRGKEALDTLYAEAPEKAMLFEKNAREADNNAAQAKINQLKWAKENDELLVNASGAMLANPTRPAINAILDDLERRGKGAVDMSGPRQQLASGPDEAIPGYIAGWAANATKIREMALAEKKAEQPPVAKTSTDGLVTYDPNDPLGGVTKLPGQTPPAPNQNAAINQRRLELAEEAAARSREKPVAETPEQRRLATLRLKNEQKLREAEAGGKQLTDATAALDSHLAIHGTETDIPLFGSEGASVQNTLYADVMAGIQKARQMGVLQPGEFPFLEMAAKNPTTIWNAAQADNIRAQLKELGAQVGRGLARSRTQFAPPTAAAGPAAPGGGGLPAPKTPEDKARLPSGTRYTAPDGSVRTKP